MNGRFEVSMEAAMTPEPIRVLFLCTHNSARSQMAEALLRWLGGDRFEVMSAGTDPTRVNPMAVRAMAKLGLDISRAESTHLSTYIGQDFDYVITLCDDARETCPAFPGDPERIHWSFPDPSAVQGSEVERQRAFDVVATDLTGRLRAWVEVAKRVKVGLA
jgi:arsenate reductase